MENKHLKSKVAFTIFYQAYLPIDHLQFFPYNQANVFIQQQHNYETKFIKITTLKK